MTNYKCGMCGSSWTGALPTESDDVATGTEPTPVAKVDCPFCGANSDGFILS